MKSLHHIREIIKIVEEVARAERMGQFPKQVMITMADRSLIEHKIQVKDRLATDIETDKSFWRTIAAGLIEDVPAELQEAVRLQLLLDGPVEVHDLVQQQLDASDAFARQEPTPSSPRPSLSGGFCATGRA